MNKQALISMINSAHDSRIESAKASQKLNANMTRELERARAALTSESALSYMIRYRMNESHVARIYKEAQKTIFKIARTMIAIVDKDVNALDKYSRAVLRQVLHLKDQTRFYSYDQLKSMQSTSVTSNLSASLDMSERRVIAQSTLSAQTPTTIHALSMLNLCETKDDNAKKYVRFNIDRKDIEFVQQLAEKE